MTPISHAHRRGDRRTNRHSPSRTKFAFYAAFLALFLAAALPSAAQDQKDSQQSTNDKDKDGIGFNLGQNTSAKDVGLPLYPGSRRHKDNDDDNSALNMGLWGGIFRLQTLRHENGNNRLHPKKSQPSTAKRSPSTAQSSIAAMPQTSGGNSRDDAKKKSSKALTCEDEKPKPGEISLKSGSKAKEHAVGIQPNGAGTLYQLVYVETRGAND